MAQYIVKVLLSALVIVAVAELGKRSSFWAAALASRRDLASELAKNAADRL